jgi:hypothetical protein
MVKAAVKSLLPEFTVPEIYEELANRGRPPRKEYIPIMLWDLGYSEEGGQRKVLLLHYGLVILRNHYPLATIFVSTTLYATEIFNINFIYFKSKKVQ